MVVFADDAPNVAGSVIMFTVLALFSYALRVYCRVSRKAWGAEDWIMTAAVVCPSEDSLARRHQLMTVILDTLRCARGWVSGRIIQRNWNSHVAIAGTAVSKVPGGGTKGGLEALIR